MCPPVVYMLCLPLYSTSVFPLIHCPLVMAIVYRVGIQPVKQDGTKALECYERVLNLHIDDYAKAKIYYCGM